jgi:hypothetical protein
MVSINHNKSQTSSILTAKQTKAAAALHHKILLILFTFSPQVF